MKFWTLNLGLGSYIIGISSELLPSCDNKKMREIIGYKMLP